MRLLVPVLLIIIFLWFRLIRPMHCGIVPKCLCAAAMAAIGAKFQLYQIAGGSFFAPRLPFTVMAVCEILYAGLVTLFFLTLALDLAGPALKILRIQPPCTRPEIRTAILAAAALSASSFGFYEAVRVPDTRTIDLETPGLPQGLDGLTIAQLTDLHIGPILKRDWVEKVTRKTNGLNPDIIVVTGDLVDGTVSENGPELEPLAGLKARLGVYGITGNHEYYSGADAWTREFLRLGLDMLHNEHRVPARGIVLAGVPDNAERQFGAGEGPLPEKAFRNAPEGVRILLSHRPCVPPDIPGRDVFLQLSGHTHGGMTFFLAPLIAAFNRGFVSGMAETEPGRHVHTSPGTALWCGFSCRIGVPSEITLFRLHAVPAAVR